MAARRVTIALVAALVSSAALADGNLPPPAYQMAAYIGNVPAPVLYALALNESGVRVAGGRKPWPWTLNVAGKSFYFKNRQSACASLTSAMTLNDHKRIDVGLGQINIGWHRQFFRHPCDALDPYLNLQVAARILRGHYDKAGDWVQAAGRYHRPAGGMPARQYRAGFSKQYATVMDIALSDVPGQLATSNLIVYE